MTAKEKQKQDIHKLHKKHYGKREAPKTKVEEAVAPVLGNTGHKAGSRADLMDQARHMGVKNFRVLNKAELIEVTKEGVDQKRIDEVVAGAVTRWKAGWGKKGETIKKD